jgi:hypothetical protein
MLALAVTLHRVTVGTHLAAIVLASSMAALVWRGGAWRRGAMAGVLAGLPPLIAPAIVWALTMEPHCAGCNAAPTLPCMLACFGTSSLVGIWVGYRAISDATPRVYALAAITTAAAAGLLGCGTTGLGGAMGVVVGLVAGGLTGWVVARRAATA